MQLGVAGITALAKALGRTQPPITDELVAGNGLPVSERLAGEVLSLPMHPYLAAATQDRIVEAVEAAVRA